MFREDEFLAFPVPRLANVSMSCLPLRTEIRSFYSEGI
jgi:hypothetical protein